MRYINTEINTLLEELNSYIISPKLNNFNIHQLQIDKKIINTKIGVLDLLIQKKPINIIIYNEPFINIKTNIKCIKCERIAEYHNINNELYCWFHVQHI